MALVSEKRVALWEALKASHPLHEMLMTEQEHLLTPVPNPLRSTPKRTWEKSMARYRHALHSVVLYVEYKLCMKELCESTRQLSS